MHNSFGHRWTGLLGWLADRPVPAAIAATALLAVVAALIRPPTIEGSMVDQLSGATEGLAVVRQIAAATGDPAVAAVIVTPGNTSIASLFADLDHLRAGLGELGNDVTLRSVDAAREQLFVYGLAPADPVSALLQALHGTPDAGAIISNDAERFLLLVRSPRELQEAVLDMLDQHVWPDAYTDITVLANAQLEREVARELPEQQPPLGRVERQRRRLEHRAVGDQRGRVHGGVAGGGVLGPLVTGAGCRQEQSRHPSPSHAVSWVWPDDVALSRAICAARADSDPSNLASSGWECA